MEYEVCIQVLDHLICYDVAGKYLKWSDFSNYIQNVWFLGWTQDDGFGGGGMVMLCMCSIGTCTTAWSSQLHAHDCI